MRGVTLTYSPGDQIEQVNNRKLKHRHTIGLQTDHVRESETLYGSASLILKYIILVLVFSMLFVHFTGLKIISIKLILESTSFCLLHRLKPKMHGLSKKGKKSKSDQSCGLVANDQYRGNVKIRILIFLNQRHINFLFAAAVHQ